MRVVAVLLGSLALGACATAPKTVTVVPFALGAPTFAAGDSIEIDEIVGTRPRLEVGGVYVLSGRALVASPDGARVSVHSTGNDNRLRTKGHNSVVVPEGESEFRLAVAILADGDLHITLARPHDEWANDPFGGVYFRDPGRPFLFGGVQYVRAATEPVNAGGEHARLTVTRASWRSAPGEEGFIQLDVAEWFDDQDGSQYKRFTEACDREFVLSAPGAPDVAGMAAVGSVTGPGVHACILAVDRAALRPGTAYRIVPRNRDDRRTWVVADTVTITR